MKTKFGPRRSRGFLYKSLFMHEIFQNIYIYLKKIFFSKKILNQRCVWLQCTHRKIVKHNKRKLYLMGTDIMYIVLKSRHKKQHSCEFLNESTR